MWAILFGDVSNILDLNVVQDKLNNLLQGKKC